MEKKKVYITRKIPNIGIELLKKHFHVEINPEDRPLTKEEIMEKVVDKDAVLTQLTDVIDDEVLEKAQKKTKIFANYAVGFNNIDIDAATKRGIQITNTPDVLTDTTAELAWALLFSVARRVVEGHKYIKEGKWQVFSPNLLLGQDIYGKTLGVIGAGRIGKAFAKKSLGFDMKILYHNRKRDEEFEKELNAKWVDKDTILKEADFISIHVPLTKETRYMIGERELKLMKRNAILINTARGPVVDEKALVKALKEGEIWGAGLDVFENEPEVEEELLELDNVVLTPHIGSASKETREKMAKLAAENIIAVLSGKEAITPVNRV
ncbi:2-hydroxyacid dehydrogenase [Thermohalobacter berrensis]|uniref:D-glycerate dehydrogenase n=1 Tax=Thermohalobacter berrensis TaxID=99594 RepID=A0A419SV96_9FIRM|nr:D-glycerate dehydrogenase [Thermohalobacter berrensis]RKD29140.1 D-glycerate dehydrogenase [Thermohalobacter berrensis]